MGDTDKAMSASSSDEENENKVDENCVVTKAINRVLDDWFVSGFSRFAAKQFIQKKLEDDSCERVREWLLLRMNNRFWQVNIFYQNIIKLFLDFSLFQMLYNFFVIIMFCLTLLLLLLAWF